MKRWIDYDVELNKSSDRVVVVLREHSQEDGKERTDYKIVAVKGFDLEGLFGRLTLEQIERKVAKIKFDMYLKYKKNLNYHNLVERLCEETAKGSQVIDGPRTTNLINFFAKRG